jgi:peptidoglycan/xylan/chitin deacetylase (PgdA/CDA1 family)
MNTGKSRPGATRRAVLVVGGAALLAGVWKDPARHPATAAQPAPAQATPVPSGHVQVDAAHPAKTRRHRHRDEPKNPDEIMYYIHDGRKGIALTIDDGPSPEYTPQVLRLLAKYKVTATFSMIGLAVPCPLRRLVPGRPRPVRPGRPDPARLVRRPPRLVPPRRALHRRQHHAQHQDRLDHPRARRRR